MFQEESFLSKGKENLTPSCFLATIEVMQSGTILFLSRIWVGFKEIYEGLDFLKNQTLGASFF
jgi:hypothetical protein